MNEQTISLDLAVYWLTTRKAELRFSMNFAFPEVQVWIDGERRSHAPTIPAAVGKAMLKEASDSQWTRITGFAAQDKETECAS